MKKEDHGIRSEFPYLLLFYPSIIHPVFIQTFPEGELDYISGIDIEDFSETFSLNRSTPTVKKNYFLKERRDLKNYPPTVFSLWSMQMVKKDVNQDQNATDWMADSSLVRNNEYHLQIDKVTDFPNPMENAVFNIPAFSILSNGRAVFYFGFYEVQTERYVRQLWLYNEDFTQRDELSFPDKNSDIQQLFSIENRLFALNEDGRVYWSDMSQQEKKWTLLKLPPSKAINKCNDYFVLLTNTNEFQYYELHNFPLECTLINSILLPKVDPSGEIRMLVDEEIDEILIIHKDGSKSMKESIFRDYTVIIRDNLITEWYDMVGTLGSIYSFEYINPENLKRQIWFSIQDGKRNTTTYHFYRLKGVKSI